MMSDHQKQALFSVSVPGGSLSFAQYLWGGRLALRWLPAHHRRLEKLLIWLCIAVVLCCISYFLGTYKVVFRSWSRETGEYLFKLQGEGVIFICLGCYILGILVARLLFANYSRRSHHSFYESNSGIHSGYNLQITDSGISWSVDDYYSFVAWERLKGVTTHDGIDYYDLGTLGFLWIPAALADYPRTSMREFINKKLRENAKK
ncbi:hypothetical protein OGW12_09565 [Citrobacter sp. Cf077]|uniref:hypothetical protein n=1 Tax=Citrobacter TaxID=544 RepID=UPI002575D635|nr:hypothetical protein [Citrobacter sp. Cf077]MDM3255156.1 hypothetical protein [Citrobacter sp. Cf077]